MRRWVLSGVLGAAMLAGCVSTPSLSGSLGAPSFVALQDMCGASLVDYGADAQSVYSAFYDAYVAQKRGALSKDQVLRVSGVDRATLQCAEGEPERGSADRLGELLWQSASAGVELARERRSDFAGGLRTQGKKAK